MKQTAQVLSEKILLLTDEQLAEVEQFVESIRRGGDRATVRASAALSEAAFEAVWNDPEDDVYDAL